MNISQVGIKYNIILKYINKVIFYIIVSTKIFKHETERHHIIAKIHWRAKEAMDIFVKEGCSISYAYTLTRNKIIRSMSIVYCAYDIGVFTSLNLDFEIRHIATAALAIACVCVPQFAPMLPKLILKSPATAVAASLILISIIRAIYKI